LIPVNINRIASLLVPNRIKLSALAVNFPKISPISESGINDLAQVYTVKLGARTVEGSVEDAYGGMWNSEAPVK
jgi:hypothetical protein